MSYSFARHETFHIRTGWLRKGLKAIEENDHIFLEDEAMEELGIGKNMVSSLRYWLQVTGLTDEDYNSDRQKVQIKTSLANDILEYDQYFEDTATFWLIHYNLVRNIELATTWFYFFNYFNYNEFNQDLLIEQLVKYIEMTGEKIPALSSLQKDFNVLVRMYLYDSADNKSPEDSLESPFSELRLFTKSDNGMYKLNRPNIDNLPPKILFYCLLDSVTAEITSVNIEDVLNKENSVGNIFKLTPTLFYKYIDKFEELNYVRLDKHAGLNSIQILEKDKEKVIKEYYQNQL